VKREKDEERQEKQQQQLIKGQAQTTQTDRETERQRDHMFFVQAQIELVKRIENTSNRAVNPLHLLTLFN
jgi:hypothetical protein